MKISSIRKIEILPLLLVIKTYMGFIMTTSPYHISFGVVILPLIWLYVIYNYEKYFTRKSKYYVFAFLILSFYFSMVALFDNYGYGKGTLFDISLFFIFVCMPAYERKKTFEYFFDFGTVLLFLAIIEYILFVVFGVGLILDTFDRGEMAAKESLYMQGLFNYYCLDSIDLMRFQSLFREPGYLGQCAGLVLILWERVNTKKILVWLIAGIMSMSLFFYVFCFIVACYHLMIKKYTNVSAVANKIKIFIVIVLICTVSFYFIPNEYKDILQSRIETIQETKTDNRSTAELNFALEKMFKEGNVTGYGATSFYKNNMNENNTGLKADLYILGVLGVIIILICHIMVLAGTPSSNKNKYLCFLFFIILYYNADVKYELYVHLLLFEIFLNQNCLFYGKVSY